MTAQTSLAGVSLVLAMLLVSLAAYLRLAHAGIGCADWPQCYGRLGTVAASTQALADQSLAGSNPYLVGSGNRAMAWAKPAHRLAASALALLVIALNVMAFRLRRHRVPSVVLLAVTAFLAVLGIRSGGLHSPAIVMGNLGGGFMLVGLLGWIVLAGVPRSEGGRSGLRVAAWLATGILVVQILAGGLTSARFAATACEGLPDCNGTYLPDRDLRGAMLVFRPLRLDDQGRVVAGPDAAQVHKLHRVLGVALVLCALAAAGAALLAGGTAARLGIAIALLVAVEFAIGVAAVLSGLPMTLAVAHNWLAGLLLLSLLALVVHGRKREDR